MPPVFWIVRRLYLLENLLKLPVNNKMRCSFRPGPVMDTGLPKRGNRMKQIHERPFTNQDLLRLLIPLVIEQLLAVTVGLADSLMVSTLGEAAVSSVSLVDSVNVLLNSLFASLAAGGAIVTGQYIGARNVEKSQKSAEQLLIFNATVALGITAVMYLLQKSIIYGLFGAIEPEVASNSLAYFRIVELSIPFLAVYSAGAALFRVMGNSKISMKISLVMNLINVSGNALLIYVFNDKIALRKLEVEEPIRKRVARNMAIFTAPYLFFLPTIWFY